MVREQPRNSIFSPTILAAHDPKIGIRTKRLVIFVVTTMIISGV
jgi:hypothetical protein